MKLLILGASGQTGQCLVDQALEAGHDVTAIVREPLSIMPRQNLTIEKADAFSKESLCTHMTGKEAVLSCLGQHATLAQRFQGRPTVMIYSETIKAIVEAMIQEGVSRIAVISSWCTQGGSGHPKLWEWLLKPVLLQPYLEDARQMEQYLEDTDKDSITYTVVKPPILATRPLDSRECAAMEGQYVDNVDRSIPRANVAKFLLDTLTTDAWNRTMVAIGLPKT